MSEAVERYKQLRNEAQALGYRPGLRMLRELYGEAGDIIYELQNEIDRLSKESGGVS